MSYLRPALTMFALLTLVTGVVYPLLVTVIAQTFFPSRANGSLLSNGNVTVGSELIGQAFDDERYFWSRPSATSPPYNGGSSSGSNFGPTNPDQMKAVQERVDLVRKAHPDQSGPISADLVTASASGLDPHISPAAAEYQITRVAKARGMSADAVRTLLTANTQGRTLGILGEPRVNVLRLNISLDRLDEERRSDNARNESRDPES